ncbi:MAG: Uma2 family endonuclease, partial [Pirellulales bacterium]
MASIVPRPGQYTFDDFLVLIKEHEKADLLDGVIYMASPESTDDNRLVAWLCKLMGNFVDELDLGEVFVTRVAFRITEKRGPEPDLAFVAKRRLRLVQRGFVDGPPDIAVEIVSPDSVERDYVVK